MMNLTQFDRDLTLSELLSQKTAAKLQTALCATFSMHWHIVDTDGQLILAGPGATGSDQVKVPLMIDIEPVGSLIAFGVPLERAVGAARWIEMLLVAEKRYRMAADLHIEAVSADYASLQSKHAQLQESERQYRELATQLERRVEEQVKVITLAQRKLYQTEKMASVGSLAAGMAHEINNPIGFIRSNANTSVQYIKDMSAVLHAFQRGDTVEAQRLWREADLDFVLEEFPVMTAESINGADRVARIIANLKRYAGIDYAVSTSVDLNNCVRTVVGVIEDQIPDGIELQMDLQALPLLECDQGRMNQMLLSILQNAHQATVAPGTIGVTTRNADSEIRIAITDTGCGIAPDVLPRIFDPFFTTREIGKGTGLGLTVSADIAATHGGRIVADSTVGAGSVFTIILPLAQ